MKILKLKEVIQLTKKSRSSIYKAILEGGFPKPIKTGKRSVAWLLEDIESWILKLKKERNVSNKQGIPVSLDS